MRSDHGYGLGPVPSSRMMATRVMIVGGSGSGKSFLALKLSELAHLPSYHMDQLSWRPGFVHRTTSKMDALTRDIHAREHWILEGGHYETSRERADRAHLLIWLDPHPALQTWRVFLRSLRHHGKVRPCMAEGCPEKFGPHTIEVVRYVWESRHFHRKQIQAIIAQAPSRLRIHRLQTAWQVRRFLSECVKASDAPGFLIPDGAWAA
jgi:adenylate kinase family enzyme